jgi:hypothetical protein
MESEHPVGATTGHSVPTMCFRCCGARSLVTLIADILECFLPSADSCGAEFRHQVVSGLRRLVLARGRGDCADLIGLSTVSDEVDSTPTKLRS